MLLPSRRQSHRAVGSMYPSNVARNHELLLMYGTHEFISAFKVYLVKRMSLVQLHVHTFELYLA